VATSSDSFALLPAFLSAALHHLSISLTYRPRDCSNTYKLFFTALLIIDSKIAFLNTQARQYIPLLPKPHQPLSRITMLTMLTTLLTHITLFSSTLATAYYPYPNATNQTNTTYPTGTAYNPPIPTNSPINIPCQTYYPSELRILNSRYPDFDVSPLHGRNNMFMLLRQLSTTFQIATQVQFQLGSDTPPNATCHLHMQLPTTETQSIAGPLPVFNLYQVEREAGVTVTWNMFEAKNLSEWEPKVFGQVNGTQEARDQQWALKGGVYDIGPALCNETLTWQMGMAFDGGEEVNYWDFFNVAPPASPSQGFRVVTGLGC
jgi:hypothetical protein